MKIDRLLGITMYLLNRDTVSANVLAEKFEVSKRTIQRDMETLNLAGIPVISTYGSSGGYEIADGFKLTKQIADADDYMYIVAALKGLFSAYEMDKLDETLEKVRLAMPERKEQNIFLDLSIAIEGANAKEYLKLIERAITNKVSLEIEYINGESRISYRIIEPLALTFKWYTWYLFSYCKNKEAYRIFKLARIKKVSETDISFSKIHVNIDEMLESHWLHDTRRRLTIKMHCKAQIKMSVQEYFNGKIEYVFKNGDFVFLMTMPENERMWFSLILGFGNQITVMEPEELKIRITKTATEILSNYKS